jgi:hypothetical protein
VHSVVPPTTNKKRQRTTITNATPPPELFPGHCKLDNADVITKDLLDDNGSNSDGEATEDDSNLSF